jgi:Fe2+ or Zn2+ uptake regulation protein
MIAETRENEEFARLCRDNGWRRTPQRRLIFGLVRHSPDHPTVEAVWHEARQKLPDISLDCVYRLLDELAGAGILRRMEHFRQMRYDANVGRHDHYVCQRCGRSIDCDAGYDLREERFTRFGSVASVSIQALGVCGDCHEQSNRKEQDDA